ncbi:MAG: AraC family transcriptional regulator [Candidatus Omnitrophica bacterium]|nr:AraC family transcriptional regulator [Candidatus Omnitrophota bacterium]
MIKKEQFRYDRISGSRFSGYGTRDEPPFFHHPAIEIQLFLHGNARYFIKDTVYQVSKNSLLIIHKNEIHRYLPHPEIEIERLNIVFPSFFVRSRKAIKQIVEKKLSEIHHIILPEKEATIIRFLMEDIIKEVLHKDAFWKDAVMASIEKIFVMLNRIKYRTEDTKKESDLIKEIISYIDLHFKNSIRLEDIARNFKRSIFTLSRSFKKTTGIGFKEYLNNKKIVEAKKMLETGSYKILTVAHECGFSDISSFNKAFKRLTGITPTMYREIMTP